MKALVIGAALAATVVMSLPATAQVVVRAGERGIVVRDGDRHYDRGHHRGWRNNRASCRTVTVRRHRPDGSVVITKRRSC